MRHLLIALTIAVLLAAPAAAQSVQAESSAQATVIFYASAPSAGGRAVAVTSLETAATAETQRAAYASLRVRSASFVFAIAKAAASGQAVGETMVRLNGSARTLASIAADLQAGLAGRAAILVFTRGTAQSGTAVSVINAATVGANTAIDVSGATHVTLVAEGRVRSFTIVKSGTTLGSITIAADGEVSTAAGTSVGRVSGTILDILTKIGIKIGG